MVPRWLKLSTCNTKVEVAVLLLGRRGRWAKRRWAAPTTNAQGAAWSIRLGDKWRQRQIFCVFVMEQLAHLLHVLCCLHIESVSSTQRHQ